MQAILFIALSSKMAEIASQVSLSMGINLIVKVSTMEEACSLAKSYPGVQAFISRGGAAQLVKEEQNKPVIDLTATVSDLMDPINHVIARGADKVAVVAHHGVLEDDLYEFSVKEVKVFVQPWKNKDELRQIIEKFVQIGVNGIVGDNACVKIARERGITIEPLESGYASVKRAINHADKIVRVQEQERMKERQYSEHIQHNVSNIYQQLERAAAAIEELNAASQQIAAGSLETAAITKSVTSQVDNVYGVLDFIGRVSQQINLLGLNAAIEAARAGEHGRGFSVVAEEVRKLAHESNDSARNISEMLNKFRVLIDDMYKKIEAGNLITQEQVKATQELAQMLEDIRCVGQTLLSFDNKVLSASH